MFGPFTRDVSKMDSVAQTVVEMQKKPIEEAKLFPELDDSPDSHKKRMVHSVTRYDRKQEEAAKKNPKRHHNHYALGHYLGAVDHAHEDMKKGHSPAEAINNNFNGSLARHLHKHLDTGDTDIDTKRRKSWGEETEQLDELSKKTLKSYKKQALGGSYDKLQRNRDSAYISGDQKGVASVDRKMKNRYYGHKTASRKLQEK